MFCQINDVNTLWCVWMQIGHSFQQTSQKSEAQLNQPASRLLSSTRANGSPAILNTKTAYTCSPQGPGQQPKAALLQSVRQVTASDGFMQTSLSFPEAFFKIRFFFCSTLLLITCTDTLKKDEEQD